MGRKKLGREPRLIKIMPELWAKAVSIAEATNSRPSYVIEDLLRAAPVPEPPQSSER